MPSGERMVMVAAPSAAPGGVTTVSLVPSAARVSAMPAPAEPKVTDETLVRLLPVIVTVVLPAIGPETGATVATAGGGVRNGTSWAQVKTYFGTAPESSPTTRLAYSGNGLPW